MNTHTSKLILDAHVPSREFAMTFQSPATTWTDSEYALIDFGEGRKLERFGSQVLDRPCPAAERAKRALPAAWGGANLVIDAKGRVVRGQPLGDGWRIRLGELRFSLAVTPFGHVGLFPEQAENWRWLVARAREVCSPGGSPGSANRPSALNLFGYTGAATLFLARAGCRVAHVDASTPTVAWARRNAELNGLSGAPIRWIVDDARKFVEREVRRGNRYQMIVMDPPTYGHGPTGERWQLERDLPSLLEQCSQLLATSQSTFLVSCHTQGVSAEGIVAGLRGSAAASRAWTWEESRLTPRDASGRKLDCGMAVRGTESPDSSV